MSVIFLYYKVMVFFYMFYTLPLLSLPFAILGEELTTESRYVTENSSANLVCPFNARNDQMTWRGPPHLYPYSINSLMNSSIFKSNDLQLTGNFKSGEYILVIHKFASLHVGQYQCETTENRVAFRHQFNLSLKEKSKVEIKPSEIMCTNSSEIVIHCTLKEDNTSTWKTTWTHEYNGHPIRHPVYSVRGMISTLKIEACSFEDIGIYTCSWCSNFAQHNSSVSVDVLSKPVLVHKTVDIKDGIGFVIFKIFLYSNPKPFLMKWYDNDQPLNGLIVVNSTFMESTVAIPVYGTNVNVTVYSVFLQTKHMPLLSSTIYKCHIENSLGFINVVFNDLNTPEFGNDMHAVSTMVIPSIKTETSLTDSLQIYIPVASSVIVVCLLLTAVIIVLRKKSIKEKKGKANAANLHENTASVVHDVALPDARPQSVPSVHDYEDVESISSSDSDQSYINRGYANSDSDVRDNSHYINTIALRIYEDLNPNTRNEINIYDRRVEYSC